MTNDGKVGLSLKIKLNAVETPENKMLYFLPKLTSARQLWKVEKNSAAKLFCKFLVLIPL